jgi:hypothetical protein
MRTLAENIIAKCGGAKAVAELLEKARAANVDLRPDDFFASSVPAPRQDGAAS